MPGASLKSKPTWRITSGCSATSVFLFLAAGVTLEVSTAAIRGVAHVPHVPPRVVRNRLILRACRPGAMVAIQIGGADVKDQQAEFQAACGLQ